jgi:nicotinamidase/pyrazinamidase
LHHKKDHPCPPRFFTFRKHEQALQPFTEMEKQQIGLITSIVANVILAILLIFFIFKLNASTGTVESSTLSPASKALLAPDLGCVQVNSGDALLIIDVQNDFMPARPFTAQNPRNAPGSNLEGSNLRKGSLAVLEAENIVSHINPLIDTFEAAKGTIIYSLDWHPTGHCSFSPKNEPEPVTPSTPGICRDDKSTRLVNEKGEKTETNMLRWPVHCVQGTWGAQFDPHLKISTSGSSYVVKKGFWDDYDSYSAFGGRMSKFSPSSPSDVAIVDADANWENMKIATKRVTDILKEKKIQRLFIVGIATDFCVASSIEDALIALREIPGLAVATIKEALGAVFPDKSKGLFETWNKEGVAVLSENNKDKKPLFNIKC